MEKYINAFPAGPYSVCFSCTLRPIHIVSQIMERQENMKFSLPTGLCIYRKGFSLCKEKSFCFCCLVNHKCYLKMDVCKSECAKHAPLGIEASKKHVLPPSHVIYG
ncbi:hypothetical protein VPH35_070609 [Triticum aestivum]